MYCFRCVVKNCIGFIYLDPKSLQQMEMAAQEVNNVWQHFESQSDSRTDEVAPEGMFQSDLDDVLRSIGRGENKAHPLVVDCGFRPANFR